MASKFPRDIQIEPFYFSGLRDLPPAPLDALPEFPRSLALKLFALPSALTCAPTEPAAAVFGLDTTSDITDEESAESPGNFELRSTFIRNQAE
jgi:hypothetical protein